MGSNTPNFDRMVGNSICKQVEWDENHEYLAAWEGTQIVITCHANIIAHFYGMQFEAIGASMLVLLLAEGVFNVLLL